MRRAGSGGGPAAAELLHWGRFGDPTIRVLATILAALLLAIGLTVGGFSLLWTLRRAPVTTDMAPGTEFATARPTEPARLQLAARPRAFATPASAKRTGSGVADRTVVVSGILVEQLQSSETLPATTGIGVFLPVTGALVDWAKLPGESVAVDGASTSLEVTVQAPAGEVLLTLAPSIACARHSFFTQATVNFANSDRVSLAANLTPVEFLTKDTDHTPPLQLIRVGDAEWHPHGAAAAGLRVTRTPTSLVLGAGDYELVDAVRAATRQRFTVPVAGPVILDASLAQPRGRKP